LNTGGWPSVIGLSSLNENPEDCLYDCGMRVLVRIPSTSLNREIRSATALWVLPTWGTPRRRVACKRQEPPQTRHIIALGKNAIPLLIGCLRDETATKESVVDFWPTTTVGDIAFSYLCDLFTDSTWKFR
jgi:hypothetical protein